MDMHVGAALRQPLPPDHGAAQPQRLAILTVATLFGRPDLGIEIVAVWVAMCLVVHAVRIAQAAFAQRHGPLKSWLA